MAHAFPNFEIKNLKNFLDYPLEDYDVEIDPSLSVEYLINQNPFAKSRWFNNDQQMFEWRPCKVLGYQGDRFEIEWVQNKEQRLKKREENLARPQLDSKDPYEYMRLLQQKEQIQILAAENSGEGEISGQYENDEDNGGKKLVKRLNLMFNSEDEEQMERRRLTANFFRCFHLLEIFLTEFIENGEIFKSSREKKSLTDQETMVNQLMIEKADLLGNRRSEKAIKDAGSKKTSYESHNVYFSFSRLSNILLKIGFDIDQFNQNPH